MTYVLYIVIIICLYTILAQSLSIISDWGGSISLAHAGFFGIGAYCSAIIATSNDIPGLLIIPSTLILSILLAWLLALIAIRVNSEKFLIVTLGVQIITFSTINNWQNLTGGALGINNIPSINIIPNDPSGRFNLTVLSLVLTFFSWFTFKVLARSKFGLSVAAIRDSESFASSIGINTRIIRTQAFILSGVFASLCGILFAFLSSYIDPSSFTLDFSITILVIMILGSSMKLFGIFLSATFYVLLPELFKSFDFPSIYASSLRQILFGCFLIVYLIRFKPSFLNHEKSH